MLKGLSESSKYEYRVEMVNQREPYRQCVVREFSSDFEVGECWGYNRFYRIDLLEREGFLGEEDDDIILKYLVRAPTFQQQSRDQTKYIEQLEMKVKSLQAEVNQTKLNSQQAMTSQILVPSHSSPSPLHDIQQPEQIEENKMESEDQTEFHLEANESFEDEESKYHEVRNDNNHEYSVSSGQMDQQDNVNDYESSDEEEDSEDVQADTGLYSADEQLRVLREIMSRHKQHDSEDDQDNNNNQSPTHSQ